MSTVVLFCFCAAEACGGTTVSVAEVSTQADDANNTPSTSDETTADITAVNTRFDFAGNYTTTSDTSAATSDELVRTKGVGRTDNCSTCQLLTLFMPLLGANKTFHVHASG